MATTDYCDGDYLGAYRRFLEHFVTNVCMRNDQLPVKMSRRDVRECELAGEVADITLQHLNQRICPPSLQAYLVKLVREEFKVMFQKQPEDCGYRHQDKTFSPLKLMQAVTNKVNEICQRYLDNSRLALLPPPPSIPLPLASSHAIRNRRRKMEDRSVVLHDLHTMFSINNDSVVNYYAVFDGHGGQEAATYCAAHLHQYLVESPYYPMDPQLALRDAFHTTDRRFIEIDDTKNSGATAVCALLYDKTLYIAWAGDSQAALIKNGRGINLTIPHKPERPDEKKRIEAAGGEVIHFGTWRVNGVLNVSRSLGDVKYKPFVSEEPEIKKIELDGTEDFLIVACDGFWERATEDIVASLLYEYVGSSKCDYNTASEALVIWARQNFSEDNISVIVVFLTPPAEIAAKSFFDPRPVQCAMEPGYQQDQQPFDLDFGFSKQPSLPTQQANGNDDAFGLANARLEPINGRHRPKPPKYNDEDDDDEDEEDDDEDVDLGPETNVDMVDDVPEEYGKLDQAMGQNYPDEFLVNPVKTEHNDYPMDGIKNERHQNELIPESDNVADSEDSEDEWNYYRPGENNKGDTNTTAEADVSNNDLETTVIEVTSAAVSSIQEPTAPSASEINIIGHKDPSLVEKIDHSEEERELCSPKPSEDNSNPLDNNSAASNRAISPDYEADDVTAEFDELHEKESTKESKEDKLSELDHELKEIDTEAEVVTLPEEDLPFDKIQSEQQQIEQSNDKFTEQPFEQQNEQFTEQPLEHLHDQFTEQSFEQPRDQFTEQSFEPPQDQFAEQLLEQPQDHLTEKPLDQAHDKFTEELLEQPQEQLIKESFEEPKDQITEQSLNQPQQSEQFNDNDQDSEDMESHLNPDAAEFVPTTTTSPVMSQLIDMNSDLVAGSPLKQSQRALKNRKIPSEEEFQQEVSNRPSELDDTGDFSNGEISPNKEKGGFDVSGQKTVLTGLNLDESEISSTKAEFGDETANFSVASELYKTGVSTIDCSYTGSERGDFDFSKNDTMTTSMTPGDFKAAFEQEPDLNKVHELNDDDLMGDIQNGTYEESNEKVKVDNIVENICKDKIELDCDNFVPQQQQSAEVFSAIVDQRESDNKDLFMNMRNAEHGFEQQNQREEYNLIDTMETEITSTQNDKVGELISGDIPTYASSNPFATDYIPESEQNVQMLTENMQNINIEEPKQQQFDINNLLTPEEPMEDKEVQNEVMQNPLNLNFGMASAEQKSDEPVLVSPVIEPEVMASKFEEENLMSQSMEAMRLEPEPTEKPMQDELFLQTNHVEDFSSVAPQPEENIINEPSMKIHNEVIDNFDIDKFDKKPINLSESLQEFTGLEEQLCPKPQQHEIKDNVIEEPQILKENLVDEQKDVEEVATPSPVPDVKVEETPIVTNEQNVLSNEAPENNVAPVAEIVAAAAATTAVAAAATTAAAAVKSPKPATAKTSKPAATSKVGAKSTTQMSPAKTGIGAKAGATAAAKKPAAASTPPRATKTTVSKTAATATTKSAAPMKSTAAAKPASTATKPAPRTATSTASTRKSLSSVTSKISSTADKKPTANGEVKPAPKSTMASKTASKAPATSTASKPGLVKTSTTRTSTGTTTTASRRPITAATTKTTTSRVGTTNVTSSTNSTAASRPKTAPTSTITKSKVGTTAGAKSPMIDKQIKETANKQISSARTGTTASKPRSSTVSSTNTTTTTKRMSLVQKQSVTAAVTGSPTKKPAPITRPGAKTNVTSKVNSKVTSTTKTATQDATKVVQNGVCEAEETKITTNTTTTTTNIEEDIPKKDVSPIEPLTDNQLITAE